MFWNDHKRNIEKNTKEAHSISLIRFLYFSNIKVTFIQLDTVWL